jgi:hypothetical protein
LRDPAFLLEPDFELVGDFIGDLLSPALTLLLPLASP